ncbi:YbaK/prolyl-tRNA synthetase associated domain-containing protein [Candidatus Micrarchaeota archaeon]|nr:YbaK/prolyl-tRNA synthetase associated domain-containing protein [Candidatus Micrarchaeota archaeon]
MSQTEFENLKRILEEQGVSFQVIEHLEVRTSEESALARGTSLSEGVKALLVRFERRGQTFFVVVNLPADKKLDLKKVKKVLQAEDVALAKPEEVVQKTGCELGAVPPFAHKEKMAILVDPRIFKQPWSAFNAGLKTKSIKMRSADLRTTFKSIGAAELDVAKAE